MIAHPEVQNKQIVKVRLTVRSYRLLSGVLGAKLETGPI